MWNEFSELIGEMMNDNRINAEVRAEYAHRLKGIMNRKYGKNGGEKNGSIETTQSHSNVEK